MTVERRIEVAIIGGGMIVNDLILPSVYHLQRSIVGGVQACARHNAPLRRLMANQTLKDAFPGHCFTPWPSFEHPKDAYFPELYKEVMAALPPRSVVIIALPDHLHYPVIREALTHDQHVLCEKPFTLHWGEAVELGALARELGLFIGIEYHKRFDTRSLMAKHQYARGDFGEFAMGEAKMIEPYFYRSSNFQNWFTCENTDPFVYVGCHYVDLVSFITGLKPVAVSVSGVKGRFPNGNEGYIWANGRVIFENDAILSVTDGLGYPDAGAGSNEQCLAMFCEGEGKSGLIEHDDQDRGVRHCYLEEIGGAGSRFNYASPDFFRLVPWTGEGLMPVGYGYQSIAATVQMAHRIESEAAGLDESASLARRQAMIDEADAKSIIATPGNSSTNELVTEGARLSILHDGDMVDIVYGEKPYVTLRH